MSHPSISVRISKHEKVSPYQIMDEGVEQMDLSCAISWNARRCINSGITPTRNELYPTPPF